MKSKNQKTAFAWPKTLRKVMLDNNLNQTELAQLLDCSPALIAHYFKEIRVPTFKKLAEFARVLKVSPQWLLFGDNSETIRYNPAQKLIVTIISTLEELEIFTKRSCAMENTQQNIFGFDITDHEACSELFECKTKLPQSYRVIALIDQSFAAKAGHAVLIKENMQLAIKKLAQFKDELTQQSFTKNAEIEAFSSDDYVGTIVSYSLEMI